MPYSDYRNLAPIDDAESSDEYLTVLEGALNDPRVKNIAIAGAYGSGKSSMIETFLKSGCITGKYLKVSMALFAMDTGRNDGKLSADEVEQGILKQLFYQVSPNKIPQSRYRKLQSIDPYHLFLRWTFLGGVIIFLSSIVFPNIFEPNIKYIMSLGNTVGVSSFVSIILVVEIFLLIIKWLAYTYGDTLTHIKIKMLNIFSDVKVEYGASEQSVFNKNLDEIVYFFEKTKYRYVFFEDLDRLKNVKIFTHLRELNFLLNNAESIRKTPVIFIYAVREDLFSKYERTKFFDFIIPIIPVVSPSNSGDVLLRCLKSQQEKAYTVSEDFVLDISPYVDDMRIIYNICNEFLIYKRTLGNHDLSLSDEKMLAMLVFKNLYPRIFSDAQMAKGLVRKAFDNKPKYIKKQQDEIKQKIKAASDNASVEEIIALREQLTRLPDLSLKDILDPDNIKLLKKDVKNDLLVFLLRRGYIDENYALYINYFKGDSLTVADMDFILAVKNLKPKEFEYHLTRPDLVIRRLNTYDFKEKAIYNFDLLEELLLEKTGNTQLSTFLQQLSDGDSWSWRFLWEVPYAIKQKGRFIKELVQVWSNFWKDIYEYRNIPNETRLYYLALIVSYLDESTLKALNDEHNLMSRFFTETPNILQDLALLVENPTSISGAIKALKLEFDTFTLEGIPTEVLDYIFANEHYKIRLNMIKNIVAYKQGQLPPDFPAKSYTIVKGMEYQPLLDYIHKKPTDYVTYVIFAQEHPCDDAEDVIDLAEHLIANPDLCESLIEREFFIVQNILSCCHSYMEDHREIVLRIWNKLLSDDKIDITWHNIIAYWNAFGMSAILKGFIVKHAESLRDSVQTDMNDNFLRDFVAADFHAAPLRTLLPVLRMEDFDLDITDIDHIALDEMIEAGFLPFAVEYYEELFNKPGDLALHYILKNQEVVVNYLEDMEMDDTLFEQLILSSELKLLTKSAIFERYGEEHMTDRVAKNMVNLGLSASRSIFLVAWRSHLSEAERKSLFFAYLEELGADDLEKVFVDLPLPYKAFANRNSGRYVAVSKTENNLKLLKHLESIGYITKYKEKKSPKTGKWAPMITTEKVLACHVKKRV